MSDRCEFRIDVRERERRCADRLLERHGDSFENPEIGAFADLPTTDGVWRCPRPAGEGERCAVHAADATDADVVDAVERSLEGEYDAAVRTDGRETTRRAAARRFLGVRAGILDLAGLRAGGEGGPPLDFRCATVDEFRLTGASIPGGIRAAAGTFETVAASDLEAGAGVGLRHATVDGSILLDGSEVDGRVDCRFATVDGDVDLDGATAASRFDLGFAAVDGVVSARKGTCGGRFTLKEAAVASVDADGIAVSGPDPDSDIPGLQFRGLTARRGVSIADCDCEGMLIGYDVTTGGDFDASEAWIGDRVTFGRREETNLPEASIGGTLDVSEATIDESFTMLAREQYDTVPEVGGALRFDEATVGELLVAPSLTHDRLAVVDCRGATIRSGTLGRPDAGGSVTYDLTEATVGAVDLEGGEESVADGVWFDRTTFDGFRFTGDERADFAADGWRLVDPDGGQVEEIAYARAFPDAAGYTVDLRTLLATRPALREWIRTTEPPYDVAAVAERTFEGVDGATVERIARNGPETPDQLGRRAFQRERYRTGVATFLARELRGRDHPIAALFEDCGEAVRALADAVAAVGADDRDEDGGSDGRLEPVVDEAPLRKDEAVDTSERSLRNAAAATLADPSAVRPSLEDRELTYIMARKGADDVGDSNTAGRFFVHEGRMRRRTHRERGAYGQYATSVLFDLIAGYGERPRRTFGSSVLVVVAFAVLYRGIWFLDPSIVPPTYESSLGAVLLSLASFTAFVLGGVDVAPLPIRALASLEAFLGAFLLALFVFTLTRSLHR